MDCAKGVATQYQEDVHSACQVLGNTVMFSQMEINLEKKTELLEQNGF